MKMNYLRIHNRGERGRKGILLILLFSVILIALFHFFYPTALAGMAHRISRPFWKAEATSFAFLNDARVYFASKQSLAKELEELKRLHAEDETALLFLGALQEENARLKELMGRPSSTRRILAAVLATPPASLYDTMILDVGSRQGITEGALVFARGVALGRIGRVHARTSLVELFSTAGTNVPVAILHGSTLIPGEAVGEGGETFKMVLPKEIPLRKGDILTMPGINPHFFGVLEVIETTDSDSFQTLYFKSPVPLGSLKFAEVELE